MYAPAGFWYRYLYTFILATGKETKPAGAESDFRSVANKLAMRASRHNGYKDISKSWACCVLTRGMLIQDKASKKVILSLGHYASAAWGFEVDELSHDATWEYCRHGVTLDEARARVRELVVQSLAGPSGGDADEQYCAVPASACLTLRSNDTE